MTGARARIVDAIELVVLVAMLLYALWCVPFVPSLDGPHHLAACVLANRLDDPSSPLHVFLEHGAPLTNRGFQEICEVFEGLFGWRRALPLTLTVIALVFAFGYRTLARTLDARSPFASFGFVAALSWAFYMGFYEFVLGTAVSMFGLAYCLRRPVFAPRDAFVAGLIALLIAPIHTFTAAVFGIGVSLISFTHSDPKDRWRNLVRLALSGIPAFLIFFMTRPEGESGGATVFHSFGERFVDLFNTYVGGSLLRGLPPVLLTGGLGIFAWSQLAKKTGSISTRTIAVFSLALVVIFFSLPYDLHGWAHVSPRPLLLGLSLAPLGVTLVEPRLRWAARALVFAIACVVLTTSAAFHQREAPRHAEILAGLDAPLKRTGFRMPLFLEEDESYIYSVQPTINIGHYYLFDQGGVDHTLFADAPKWDALLFKESLGQIVGWEAPRYPRFETHPQRYEAWAYVGLLFEDVILFSKDPAALQTFLKNGYVIDFQKGDLSIIRATPDARRRRANDRPPKAVSY